ncbi:hypothetical protein C8R46DRAFT_427402 [Mycena filopes]|nr:hypothetical protein C8R46DRAFT_427402 [Mycena filopes]
MEGRRCVLSFCAPRLMLLELTGAQRSVQFSNRRDLVHEDLRLRALFADDVALPTRTASLRSCASSSDHPRMQRVMERRPRPHLGMLVARGPSRVRWFGGGSRVVDQLTFTLLTLLSSSPTHTPVATRKPPFSKPVLRGWIGWKCEYDLQSGVPRWSAALTPASNLRMRTPVGCLVG